MMLFVNHCRHNILKKIYIPLSMDIPSKIVVHNSHYQQIIHQKIYLPLPTKYLSKMLFPIVLITNGLSVIKYIYHYRWNIRWKKLFPIVPITNKLSVKKESKFTNGILIDVFSNINFFYGFFYAENEHLPTDFISWKSTFFLVF